MTSTVLALLLSSFGASEDWSTSVSFVGYGSLNVLRTFRSPMAQLSVSRTFSSVASRSSIPFRTGPISSTSGPSGPPSSATRECLSIDAERRVLLKTATHNSPSRSCVFCRSTRKKSNIIFQYGISSASCRYLIRSSAGTLKTLKLNVS
jgi:hypothetical protein